MPEDTALAWPDPALVDPTAGLRLRRWRVEDAPALAAAWAVGDIGEQAAPPGTASVADAERWIAGTDVRLREGLALDLVVAPATGPDAVWGEVGLSRLRLRAGPAERHEWDVGWWVRPERRGRGVATAAARLLVAWATTDLGLGRVVARIERGAAASEAVATRAGLGRLGPAGGAHDLWGGPV